MEKEAALIGVEWRHVETIFTKFQILSSILVQFVDYHVCIMNYYGIAIHKLVQNFIEKLKNLAKIVKFTYYCPHAKIWLKIRPNGLLLLFSSLLAEMLTKLTSTSVISICLFVKNIFLDLHALH